MIHHCVIYSKRQKGVKVHLQHLMEVPMQYGMMGETKVSEAIRMIEKDDWILHVEITKIASFLKVLELIKKLVIDCTLVFSPSGGMTIIQRDTNRVALMNLVLRPNYFSHFHCRENLRFTLTVSVLYDAIKSMTASNVGSVVSIRAHQYSMELICHNQKFGETTQFRLQCLESKSDEEEFPGANTYPSYTSISSKRLVNVCQVLKSMNVDTVEFLSHGNEYYEISGSSPMVEKYTCRFELDQGQMLGAEYTHPVRRNTSVALFYVQTVAQAHKLNDKVQLCFGTNTPFVMRYVVYQGVDEDHTSYFTVWIHQQSI